MNPLKWLAERRQPKRDTIHGLTALKARGEVLRLRTHIRRLMTERTGKYGTPEWDQITEALNKAIAEFDTISLRYFGKTLDE